MEHTMEFARGQHELIFSTLVQLQVIPDPKECTSYPFSGFEDAGDTIQLEPKLLLDETDGRYFGKEYPLERNSNATLTVGDTLRLDVPYYTSKYFCYVAHLRASPRTLRTTTRKRYCALLYVLFCGDIGDNTFDPTNEFLIEKILEDNPTPSGVQTRLYPSNQYLWVDAAALLTYGHHIFVEGVSPPRDNIGEVQYLATHLLLYPKAHGDWRLQNDNYGVGAQFCPLKRRDGSRNFPFRLEGFHDRDDVTPSPLLIEETWEQIAKLYDFTEVGRERALIRSEAREALIKEREHRKSRHIESDASIKGVDGNIQPTPEPAASARKVSDKRLMKDRMQKRRRESSKGVTEGMNAVASQPALKKAKTTTAVDTTDAAVSSEPQESKETRTTQPTATADNSPQGPQLNDIQMPDSEDSTDAAAIAIEARYPLDGGRLSYVTPDPSEARGGEAPPQVQATRVPNADSTVKTATGTNADHPTATTTISPTVNRRDPSAVATTSGVQDKIKELTKKQGSNEKPKPNEEQSTREEAVQAEKRAKAEKSERIKKRKAEAEAASKQREDAIRADMAKEAKQREDKLIAELQCLHRKLEDEARTATQRSEEMAQEHKRREEALRIELEVEARIAFERREWVIRIEMEKEHKQREDALRVELESVYQKRSAEEQRLLEMEKVKMRAELESVSRRDAERCVELESELTVEREKQAGMKRKIEILEEENGILIAEKELGERKARLEALRGKDVK